MSPGRYRSAPVPGRPVTPYSSAPVGEATGVRARMEVMPDGSVFMRREEDGRAVWHPVRPPRSNPLVAGPGMLIILAVVGAMELSAFAWDAARALTNVARALALLGWRLAVLAAVAPWRAVRTSPRRSFATFLATLAAIVGAAALIFGVILYLTTGHL